MIHIKVVFWCKNYQLMHTEYLIFHYDLILFIFAFRYFSEINKVESFYQFLCPVKTSPLTSGEIKIRE